MGLVDAIKNGSGLLHALLLYQPARAFRHRGVGSIKNNKAGITPTANMPRHTSSTSIVCSQPGASLVCAMPYFSKAELVK